MHIQSALQKEYSKKNTENIAEYILSNDERLAELMEIYLSGPSELAQAAWVLGKLAGKTDLLSAYLPQLINKLKEADVHDTEKRNALKVWSCMEIPSTYHGDVTMICFDLLAKKAETVGVKVFSMIILQKIVMDEPGLINELRFTIEEQMPYASAGFRSRGKKVLKAIENY